MLTKTNYILYRECPKNAWLKVNKPDVYRASPLSEFEKLIIETGNEVDVLARELFPTATFQKQFEKDGFMAIPDILIESESGVKIYEVKATNDVDEKVHTYDLAFQYVLLKKCGVNISSASILHLNPEYVREGELELTKLFKESDITETIKNIAEEVEEEMEVALKYIKLVQEPPGFCACVYKGRSRHCTTFNYSNPHIPEYGVHDLARIGSSKKKLTGLVDGSYFNLHEIPEHFDFTDIQKNQIWTMLNDREIISREKIAEELDKLTFPLYFLDYETFPSALPRFDKFSPYQQIPFQYSLHVLHKPDGEPEHYDFLYTDAGDPSKSFYKSLQSHIGPTGRVIVWHKGFECSRNKEIAKRIPESRPFFANLETRIYDLEDIFKNQYHVHKNYKGSSSIKKVLPVLAPELSYSDLAVQEGGSAAELWDKLTKGVMKGEEWEKGVSDLREYCKRDTYAMYAIWRELYRLVN